MEKYKFTGEAKTCFGHMLRRIRAVVAFANVAEGEIGGWIETEGNLSHDGGAWVSGSAKVFGDAEVYDNAKVSGDAMVFGSAKVFGDAEVYDNAKVYGDAMVFGDAEVYDNAEVSGDACVYGDAMVFENAMVFGNAEVYGNAEVCGNAKVSSDYDYAVFKNFWSSYRWFTYTRSNKLWTAGCFHGTGRELVANAYKDSERSGKCYEAVVKAMETIEEAMS